MTPSPHTDYLPSDYTPLRRELYPLLGQRVQGEATFTRKCRWLCPQMRMLRDVVIGADVWLDHCWVVPSPFILKQLEVGKRFRFSALVVEYQRTDRTRDCGLELLTLGK